ncbi:MAG: sugar ABC transporter permease [Candidatus Competibacteraceae bacterium]|nr:sugar ABC transporter permease [Candidatus Competibacteraceae bacterium]
MSNKTHNQKAWFLVLPMFLLVAFSAIIPLMAVVNYSVQDIFDMTSPGFFVGTEWYREILHNDRLHDAFFRQVFFTVCILVIEVPLAIAIALTMPTRGVWVSICLVLLALPLLIPFNVVGTIWQILGREDIGLLGRFLNGIGIDYNYTANTFDAWITVVVMDVWHWTSLLVLLCYAGLVSIPDAYYQAAKIDGASRWAVFRYIQLPKMQGVLMIGVLLRFMDSFMIYAEPFVLTGGGPGNATTFLSIYLANLYSAQNFGPMSAFSVIYFLIILLVSWLFYTILQNMNKA